MHYDDDVFDLYPVTNDGCYNVLRDACAFDWHASVVCGFERVSREMQ